MASTRILLAALPLMLEEIVTHVLRSKGGMEIAATLRTVDELSHQVARARPDVVVLGRNDPALAASLLEQSPRLRVLAVTDEGQDSWLYALTPERTRVGALSPARLVRVVERAGRPSAEAAWWSQRA